MGFIRTPRGIPSESQSNKTKQGETVNPNQTAPENQPSDAAPEPMTEAERVAEWRTEQSLTLGFNDETAYMLGYTTFSMIDLHDIESLTSNGCAPMLALEIIR